MLTFHVHPVKLASHTGANAYAYFQSGSSAPLMSGMPAYSFTCIRKVPAVSALDASRFL